MLCSRHTQARFKKRIKMLKEKQLFFVLMHFSDKWLQPFSSSALSAKHNLLSNVSDVIRAMVKFAEITSS